MILEPGRTFVDNSNRILTGGTIRFCEPGTGSITLKATYPTDADLLATTNANANPMAFNSAGRMPYAAHGSGAYRIVVRDSGGNTIYDISDVSVFDASTISFTPSTGATATDVQTFLRTEYSKSSAESGASLTITNYGYRRGDVRRYGAVDAASDSTVGFTRAALVANVHPTIIPSGTWNISSATFTDGATIITDGFSTIIKQIAGYDGAPNTQTALIKLAGSNIAFALNGVKVMGQIATDSGEHNHGVMIYKTGASIENITVGDVWGAELRGDALYIGAPNTYQTKNVRVGRVIGEDIHRNIVSIVGGNHITIDSIIAEGGVGLSTFDIEPDSGSTACTDIHVGYIRGGNIQILGQASAIIDRVTIGSVELDPAYQPDSSQSYSLHATYIETAIWFRNCRNVRIEHARIKEHTKFAATYVFSGGDARGKSLSFGTMYITGVGSADTTYNAAIVMGNVDDVSIDSVALFTPQADGDYLFLGDTSGSTVTSLRIGRMVGTGRVARYVTNGVFERLNINSAVVGDTAFVNVYDSRSSRRTSRSRHSSRSPIASRLST